VDIGTHRGDVHLGGVAGGGIWQLYCADPDVAFHGYATAGNYVTHPTAGGEYTTKDSIPDYVVVAPDALPDEIKAVENQLRWVVTTGFKDDLTGESATAARNFPGYRGSSLAEVNRWYANVSSGISGPVGQITNPVVALIATKLAVWHIVSGASVATMTTSLAVNSDDQRQMFRLLGAMEERARAYDAAYKTNPESDWLAGEYTKPQLSMVKDSVADYYVPGGIYYYYGPLRVVNDPAGVRSNELEQIFLSVEGGPYNASDIRFVQDVSGSALPTGTRYGTSDSAPYVTMTGNSSEPFYLRVPWNLTDLNGISIHAVARANVSDYKGPTLLVHQDPMTGVQNWDTVQAFVGYASNIPAKVFGEASLDLDGALNNIRVRKSVEGGGIDQFEFQLTKGDGSPVPLTASVNITFNVEKTLLDGGSGVFTLGNGEYADISLLPPGVYTVTETGGDYTAVYTVDNAAPAEGSAASVILPATQEQPRYEVNFTNTPLPTPTPEPTPTPATGAIRVHKSVTGNDRLGQYTFRLTDENDVPVSLEAGRNFRFDDPSKTLEGNLGEFTMEHDESADIGPLPVGTYYVTEITGSDHPVYVVGDGMFESGQRARVNLTQGNIESIAVSFINIFYPVPPTGPSPTPTPVPEEPTPTPGEPTPTPEGPTPTPGEPTPTPEGPTPTPEGPTPTPGEPTPTPEGPTPTPGEEEPTPTPEGPTPTPGEDEPTPTPEGPTPTPGEGEPTPPPEGTHLIVSKNLSGAETQQFDFKITDEDGNPVDLELDVNIYFNVAAKTLSGEPGVFALGPHEIAYINQLPAGTYTVTELTNTFQTNYAIDSNPSASGRVMALDLLEGEPMHLSIMNTIMPAPPMGPTPTPEAEEPTPTPGTVTPTPDAGGPTPTPGAVTPTPTPGSGEPTPTPTPEAGTPTPAAGEPTPTPAPSAPAPTPTGGVPPIPMSDEPPAIPPTTPAVTPVPDSPVPSVPVEPAVPTPTPPVPVEPTTPSVPTGPDSPPASPEPSEPDGVPPGPALTTMGSLGNPMAAAGLPKTGGPPPISIPASMLNLMAAPGMYAAVLVALIRRRNSNKRK
jgi:hypothetical protein